MDCVDYITASIEQHLALACASHFQKMIVYAKGEAWSLSFIKIEPKFITQPGPASAEINGHAAQGTFFYLLRSQLKRFLPYLSDHRVK